MVCGNYVYNQYNDCRDANYLLAGDKINDVLALPAEKINKLVPVLACADRSRDERCHDVTSPEWGLEKISERIGMV